MLKPIVTVIITSFNCEKTIASALISIQNQTINNWEAIIVDDKSSDNTIKIISDFKKKDNRFKTIFLKKHTGGPAHGRNRGIKMASARLVALMDADDLWHPQKLEIQINQINKSKYDFVSSIKTNFRSFPLNYFWEKIHKNNSKDGRLITLKQLQRKNIICLSSVLCAKHLLLQEGFPENKRYIAIEDYWCWLKIHSLISHSWLSYSPLVAYRVSQNSLSASKLYMANRNWFLFGEIFAGRQFAQIRRLLAFASYLLMSIWLKLIPLKIYYHRTNKCAHQKKHLYKMNYLIKYFNILNANQL